MARDGRDEGDRALLLLLCTALSCAPRFRRSLDARVSFSRLRIAMAVWWRRFDGGGGDGDGVG